MITAACPHLQTVRARLVSHIPGQSTSSPEHAGALGPARQLARASAGEPPPPARQQAARTSTEKGSGAFNETT
jgi:hypothetical protein